MHQKDVVVHKLMMYINSGHWYNSLHWSAERWSWSCVCY